MAKKREEASKTILERIYSIPLRRETLKVPPFRKANKAVKTVKQFISKHMKSENVVIGKYLNLKIWHHGAKNPPHHVKVNAAKDDKGKVFVELADAPKEKPKIEVLKPSLAPPSVEKKTVKKEEKGIKAGKPEEKLEKVSNLSREEAKKELLELVEIEYEKDILERIKKLEESGQDKLQARAKEIITLAEKLEGINKTFGVIGSC